MGNRFIIDRVGISITDPEDAVEQLLNLAENKQAAYVCVSNVRAVYIGNHNSDYGKVLNQSFLTVPDGKPIEWLSRLAGIRRLKRTSGPDLFNLICQRTENSVYTHFFYGSTSEVIERMKKNLRARWPGLKIAGAVAPPHGTAEELVNEDLIGQINSIRPSFVWVGLGAPKQEQFMDLIIKHVHSSILIGVGLVFDYQAGTVKRAPLWMQRTGLEWLYRDLQQPRRLPFLFWQFIYLFRMAILMTGKRNRDK